MILDIGTHVLAMLRETLRYLGGQDDMTLQMVTAKDRLGHDIAKGDLTTAEDVLELVKGKTIQRWHIPGTIYECCLAGHILGANSLFERDPQEVSRTTRRRIDEVALLLTLQQQLRGPH